MSSARGRGSRPRAAVEKAATVRRPEGLPRRSSNAISAVSMMVSIRAAVPTSISAASVSTTPRPWRSRRVVPVGGRSSR
ncbi:hypothetical protein ACWFMI_05295 [Nocardiopsis terrae]